MLKDIILKDVKSKWKEVWNMLFEEHDILDFLEKKLQKYKNTNDKIFPNVENILEAFKYFDINDTKIVFLGQDPYINSEIKDDIEIPQATGLAFSVPNNFSKVPPSLKNIFKELSDEYPNYNIPNNGCLNRWAKDENILLLNTALTVKKGKSNSHQKKWTIITDKLIEYISNNTENVIFILLGNNAKSKSKFIDIKKHTIISGVHPSPLSANRGFFGSDIFKKVNSRLIELNLKEVDW